MTITTHQALVQAATVLSLDVAEGHAPIVFGDCVVVRLADGTHARVTPDGEVHDGRAWVVSTHRGLSAELVNDGDELRLEVTGKAYGTTYDRHPVAAFPASRVQRVIRATYCPPTEGLEQMFSASVVWDFRPAPSRPGEDPDNDRIHAQMGRRGNANGWAHFGIRSGQTTRGGYGENGRDAVVLYGE